MCLLRAYLGRSCMCVLCVCCLCVYLDHVDHVERESDVAGDVATAAPTRLEQELVTAQLLQTPIYKGEGGGKE